MNIDIKRMEPDERRAQIVEAAIQIASEENLMALTASKVGKTINTSRQLVYHYFETVADLQAEVIRKAVENGEPLKVIGDAIAVRHEAVAGISPKLAKAALSAILN